MIPLLMVAGEASGDQHGARLLAQLKRQLPELAPFGLGGDELAAEGLEAVAHSRDIAVVGLVEALRVLRRARCIFAELLAEVDRRRPAVAVLIDAPEFNLRLARRLKQRGVRVIYYVSPQVWAWRRGRVRTIARRVDHMLVLFPFETDLYQRVDLPVEFVGHPLVDEVPRLPHLWERGMPREGERYRLILLPGSRPSEVQGLLPVMLGAARELAAVLPLEVALLRAPTVAPSAVDAAVAASGLAVEVVAGERFERLAASHLALCASGTATLEVGLVGTPLIVLYRLRVATWLLALLLVRLPHISLVNLVLGREVVPEMLQHAATPRRVAVRARKLLTDEGAIATMRAGLAELRSRLGAEGASRRAAQAVARLLAARDVR